MNNNNEINYNQLASDSAIRSLNIIKIFSGALTVIIGVMILAGYILGNYFAFNLGKDYIPMADETAFLFIIIGMVILLIDKSRSNLKLQYLILALSIFVGIIGILAAIDFLTNYAYNFSEILGGNHKLIGNMYIGKMSLITAFVFTIYSLSLILIIFKFEKISAIFSTLILFVSYILITGYLFGVPYLYGSSFIPVALPTAIVMLISSLGMLAAAGSDSPPLKYFLGKSTQARLMRSFIPIMLIFNLAKDLILTYGNENFDSYFALQNSIVDILSLILVSFIISLVSRSIGKSIDNNIAERKAAEETAIKSEKKLLITLNSIGDGVITTDENGFVIKMNPIAEKMCGFKEFESKGKQLSEIFNIINADTREKVVNPVGLVLESGALVGLANHTLLISNDGSEYQIADSAAPIKDEFGKILGVVLVFSDVTEKYSAVERIRESEVKYRSLVEQMQEGLLVVDNDDIIQFVNSRLCEMLGYEEVELVGKVGYEILVNESNRLKIIGKNLERQKGIPEQYELKMVSKSGEEIIMFMNASPAYDKNGKIVGSLSTCTDITERKLAEEALIEKEVQYRTLADTGMALIWTSGTDKLCNYFNEPWLNFTGRTLEQEIGNGWTEGVHPEDFDQCLNIYVSAFDKREKFDMEYRLRHVSGEYRWISDLGTPSYNSNKEFIGYIGHCFDITERKRAEEKLQYHQKLLQEMGRVAKIGGWEFEVATGKGTWTEETAIIHDLDPKDETSMELGLSFYTDESRSKIVDAIKEAIEFGKSYNLELELITGKNFHKWVQTIGHPQIANGKVINLRGSIQDITERKHVEEALSKSEEKFRNIFENAREGIFQTHINGTYIAVNPAFAKMFGFDSPEELINTIQDISKDSYYDPIERDKYLKMIKKDGFVEGYEYEVKHKDGTKLWFYEDSRAVKDENGRIQYFEGFVLDITERKKAEEEINSIASIPSENPNPLLRISNNGKLLYVNEAGLGQLPQWNLQIGQLAPNMLQTVVNNAFENCEVQLVEFKHGDTIYSFYVTPIAEAGYANLYGQDITVRKRFEKELIRSEKELKKAQQITHIGSWSLDLRTNKVIWTEELYRMYGFDSSLPPPPYTEHMKLFTPESWEMLSSSLAKTRETGIPYELELITVRKDGSNGWMWVRGESELNKDGRIVGLFGAAQDITERKLAEGKFQLQITALNAAANAIVITNNKGAIEWVNSAFTTLTGYDFTEAIGKNPREILNSGMHDNSFFQDLWDTILAGGIWRGETINRRKNGTLYNEMQTITPLIETDGKIKYFISIKEDITERKQAEQQLIIAKEHAEESDKLKTAFLQNMSHEIRTPLSGIIGFSKMLNTENLSKEDIQEFTNMITVSSERLIEIVNNVMEMSKIQTEQVKIVSEPIVINSLLSDLFDFFYYPAKEKNINLNYHNLDDTDRTIYSDVGKLYQVLSNLINNALKFTNSGSIDYGYEIIDNYIQFYVKDTGIGISEELHDKIFDRFIQADQSISRNYEGVGLGLAICKGLVELLGGGIRFESEINKGTTFYFTLPYKDEFVPAPNEIELLQNSVKIAKRKILIVEDDWVSTQYLIRFFENQGITLIHAVNGEQAVELVRNTPDIDLVLMDIKMPVMDGNEATRIIKRFRPELPIIAQTAYAFSEEKRRILEIGCNECLSKPYDTKKLIALIGKYLKIN